MRSGIRRALIEFLKKRKEIMWPKLLSYMKKEKVKLISDSLGLLQPLLDSLELHTDKDQKNVLIDSLVQILQQHKE